MNPILARTGFTVTDVFEANFGDPQIEASLKNLAATGAKTVTFQWQTAYGADGRQVHRMYATDEQFERAIQIAHRLGLEVEIRPQVFGPNEEWSGTFRPADPQKWFSSYGDLLVRYAGIAQRNGVERLFLTNEGGQINTDPSFRPYWIDIIARVRAVYSGEIGVNAMLRNNEFDANSNEAPRLVQGDLLDFIGLSVYSPLTGKANPTRMELEAAWTRNVDGRNLLAEIAAVHQKYNKPLKISEIAYSARDGGNMAPWDLNKSGQLDYQEQTDATISMLAALAKTGWSWYEGTDIWGWYSVLDPVQRFQERGPFQALFQRGGNALQDNPALVAELTAILTGSPRLITGTARTETLLGGKGIDTAVYQGRYSDHQVEIKEFGLAITRNAQVNTLVDVERLVFDDAKVAYDISGNAGQAYRLYQAAFDRRPDLPGLGYQIGDLDRGSSLAQVASNFIASPEFQRTYGSLDNTQFVTQLYRNVLDREPDATGLAFHVNSLAESRTRSEVLIGFSESPENQVAVIGSISHGIFYTQ